MPDLIYALFGPRIKRKLAALDYRPTGFDGMTLAFPGPDGKAYYTWADLGDLPAIRTKQVERVLIWMDARASYKSIEEFGEDLNGGLAAICAENDKAKRWERSTKLGALYKEIILRGSSITPEDLYFDMMAVLAISEEENPHAFDTVVHQKKMLMLKQASHDGHAFFLQLPILKRSWGSYLSSEAGFKELLLSWMMDRQRKGIARQVLSSA